MPIYEYQAIDPKGGCDQCRVPFEILQDIRDKPLRGCPSCGGRVKKLISRCRAAISESSEKDIRVEKAIKEYETSGMWSHAAELADKQSEKTKDKALKVRALDNYKKAGYDIDSLVKHAKTDSD